MRLSIPAKVFLGFATILAAFGLVTVYGLTRLQELDEGLERVADGARSLTRLAAQLDASYRSSEQATARLLDEASAPARAALLRHAVEDQPRVAGERLTLLRAQIRRLRGDAAGDDERRQLDRLEQLAGELGDRYAAYVTAGDAVRPGLMAAPRSIRARTPANEQPIETPSPAASPSPAPPSREKVSPRPAAALALESDVRRLKAVEQEVGALLGDLSTELESMVARQVRMLGEEERRSALRVLIFSLLAAAVGMVVTALSQRTLAPIGPLTEAVKEAGEGRFRPVAVGSDDELGVLAREFNGMALKLAERDRQLAERNRQLLRSEQLAAVGRLSAQVAHEVRNPLASISLNAELLEEHLAEASSDRAEARALVAAISRETDRLAAVTEEYLRFSRMPRLQAAAIDLSDATEELAAFVGAELREARITLELQLASPGPIVQADAAQLRQVLLNLVRNGREAMSAGGRLVLSVAHDGDEARLEVADSGPGLSDEARARLFEPFFTTKEHGTGLGLPLCQQVVLQHGGRIDCRSAPGEGARFIIHLPLAPRAQTVDPLATDRGGVIDAEELRS